MVSISRVKIYPDLARWSLKNHQHKIVGFYLLALSYMDYSLRGRKTVVWGKFYDFLVGELGYSLSTMSIVYDWLRLGSEMGFWWFVGRGRGKQGLKRIFHLTPLKDVYANLELTVTPHHGAPFVVPIDTWDHHNWSAAFYASLVCDNGFRKAKPKKRKHVAMWTGVDRRTQLKLHRRAVEVYGIQTRSCYVVNALAKQAF